jgi:hypothetical protein
MNVLGYQADSANGLSFILLIDGAPLVQLIGSEDGPIPYWIVDYGIPGWPPLEAKQAPLQGSDTRIVSVCGCGEYGCGHSRCRVTYSEDRVVFDQFEGDCSAPRWPKTFTFDRQNYDRVMDEITQLAAQQRASDAR